MDIKRAQEMLEKASPWPWKVRHRDIGGSEEDDEMGSGLGLDLEGPPEPMLRGQFAKAADAQLAAGAPATMAALILAVEALEELRGVLAEIRSDWTDPRHDIREGDAIIDKALAAWRAL